MKIFIKGGAWKNIEDEILKSAVMKYGKNQWDRIASLLSRKSAKQCKARWYEWLDPSIKKTEWTREEEEKLLHLVKIMPNQWRTIAPIVGRTAFQCMEHFEQLLDKYQERDEDYDPEDDPRKLKTGEVDYQAEHKPALPDPVDLDEDEKEMLSEARARMANTMGKKAKRRARERQLEEQRRLSRLKKKRELKAAGIYVIEDKVHERKKMKKRFRKIDYLKEIPFEKRAPVGMYDTTQEKIDSQPLPVERNLQRLEGRLRDKREQDERKKDKDKIDRGKKTQLDHIVGKIKQINKEDSEAEKPRRARISLPAPQITDEDLRTIAKISVAPQSSTTAAGGKNDAITGKLLSSYSTVSGTTPFPGRSIRTPMVADHLRDQTKNIVAINKAQTPFQTGQNIPKPLTRKDMAEKSAKRQKQMSVGATPNPFKNNIAGEEKEGGKRIMTPRHTPFRDGLSINEPDSLIDDGSVSGSEKGRRRAERRRQRMRREKLRKQFQTLPKPESEEYYFQPVYPKSKMSSIDDDAATRDRSEENTLKVKKRRLLMRRIADNRSKSVVMGLPRPTVVPDTFLVDVDDDNVVGREMRELAVYDAERYPYVVTKKKKKRKKKKRWKMSELIKSKELEITAEERQHAEDLVMIESEKDVDKMVPQDKFNHLWTKCVSFDQNESNASGLSEEFEQNQLLLNEEIADVDKLAKKVDVLTRGYRKIANDYHAEKRQLSRNIEDSERKLNVFAALKEIEDMAVPRRINDIQERIKAKNEEEETLQVEFMELSKRAQKRKRTEDVEGAPEFKKQKLEE